MKHRTVVPWLPCLALPAVILSGCEEYYDVDAACHEKVPGAAALDPIELDAMSRINCYRRLSGLARGTADILLQEAAAGEVSYVQQNPNLVQLLSDTGPLWWLTQRFENPGFTGAYLTERLDNVGYTLYDVQGTGFWEFIHIASTTADDPNGLPSGAAAIDELMRFPVFRQTALQPSWIDGAYAEAELPQEWWRSDEQLGTATTEVIAQQAPVGRVYYMVVLYQAPHFEHVDKPVLLPKEDQVNVPLYSWSSNRDVPVDGAYALTQVSYPITLGMGSFNPENYAPIDQNQYGANIINASIVGPEGPLETEVVHPGDEPEGAWPSGRFLRTTLAVFTRSPLQPSTTYKLFADLETKDGMFEVDFSFRTAAEDPGVDAQLGATTGSETSGPLARTSGRTFIRHYTPGSLHVTPDMLKAPPPSP